MDLPDLLFEDAVRQLMAQIGSVAGRQASLTLRVGDQLADILQKGFGRLITRSELDRNEITLHLDQLAKGIEELGATFHMEMGAIVWQQELQNEHLASILATMQSPLDTAAKELRRRADFAYQNGWFDEAIQDYQEAEKKNYQDFAIHRSLGHLFLDHLDNKQVSLEYFLKAAKYASPLDFKQAAEAHFLAGRVYCRLNNYHGAVDEFQKAWNRNDGLRQAQFWLAKCVTREPADHQLAIDLLEPVIRAESGFYHLAECDPDLAHLGEIQELLVRLKLEAQQRYATCHEKAKDLFSRFELPTRVHEVLTVPVTDEPSGRPNFLDAARRVHAKFTVLGNDEPSSYSEFRCAARETELALCWFHKQKTSYFEDTVFSGHTAPVRKIAFSPDVQWLASGSKDNTVRLWNLKNRCATNTWTFHADEVTSVAFSPDSKLLASGSRDHFVCLWDLTEKQASHCLWHPLGVASIAFSPDGRTLASAGSDESIRVWDVQDGSELCQLRGHKDGSWCVTFSPDGKLLASGWCDGKVRVWTVATAGTGGPPMEANTTRSVRSVTFSPDGSLLASGSDDEIVREWIIESGRLSAYHRGDPDDPDDPDNVLSIRRGNVVFSANGKVVATWKIAEHSIFVRESEESWERGHSGSVSGSSLDQKGYVSSLAVSSDGRFVASASRVWPKVWLWRRGFRTKAESAWIRQFHEENEVAGNNDETG